MPRLLLLAALAAFALPRPALAQDPFGIVGGLFENVNSIVFFGQAAALQSSNELTGSFGGFALSGVGVEVLLDLPSPEGIDFELGLGANAMTGLEAVEPSLDFRGSMRTIPTVSVYAAGLGTDEGATIEPYVGLSFGLAELWNARGYDAAGNVYPVDAEAFELGATVGVYVDKVLPGLYVELGYRHRKFGSLAWDTETLPGAWPRSFDASTWQATLGWQFRLRDGEE